MLPTEPIKQLLLVADAYGSSLDLVRTTVSHRVFKDSKTLDNLAGGGDMTTSRYLHALQWFSDNWSKNGVWPQEVVRPKKSKPAKQVA